MEKCEVTCEAIKKSGSEYSTQIFNEVMDYGLGGFILLAEGKEEIKKQKKNGAVGEFFFCGCAGKMIEKLFLMKLFSIRQ